MPESYDSAPRSGLAVFRELLSVEIQFGWTRWFGFACVLIWIFGLYWSTGLVSSLPGGFSNPLVSRNLWLGAEAVTLLAALALLRFTPRTVCANVMRWGSGALVTIGSSIVLLGELTPSSQALAAAGIVLTGIGSALLMVLWGVTLSDRGPQSLLIGIGFALIFASVVDFCLIYVPAPAQALCVVLAPLASASLLAFNASERAASAPRPFILETPPLPADARTLSWRVVLLPAFIGLAYGLMQQLASGNDLPSAQLTDLRTISAFFLSGAVLLLTTAFFSQDRVAQRIYFIALPIMVTAFLALPMAGERIADLQTVFIVGFNCFYFMVWALWSGYRDEVPATVARRFAMGLLVLIGAEALGLLFGSFVVELRTMMNLPISTVSLLVVYVLLMDAFLAGNRLFGTTAGRSTARAADGATRGAPDTASDDDEHAGTTTGTEDAFLARARAVADTHGLSAREQEVLMLLVRGRNKAYISKTLYISDNTTCTHMKNIYRKMGVHSHQELLDLVDERP